MKNKGIKERAILLRKKGKTYSEISRVLNFKLPKSTLSNWFKEINLPKSAIFKIESKNSINITKARQLALIVKKKQRVVYLESIKRRNSHLFSLLNNRDIAKIALSMLFLGEGAKNIRKSSVVLGNSDPSIIKLFLKLLRFCFDIDESKFRCVLQCRADQDIDYLQKFWAEQTNVNIKQFYRARIDKRTIGKPTLKLNYKGVCVIYYFSADIFLEILKIIETLTKGL